MSTQKSLLSFYSKTSTTKKEKEPEIQQVASVEKIPPFSNGTNSTPTLGRNGKETENGNGVVTSTPKRKKSESEPTIKKKAKLSLPAKNNRKRVAIESDEDEADQEQEQQPAQDEHIADDDEVKVETANGSSLAEYSFNETVNGSSCNRSVRGENSALQDLDQSDSNGGDDAVEGETEFEHTKLEFLQPDQIRDANRRRPNDEDYDPTTVYVPEQYMKDQTPGMQWWWKFKAQNFDKILLYKVGKFYELYHMDAVVAVGLLNLTFMKGGAVSDKTCSAHCGFPEISFGRFSDQLVQNGYKVARIEQTETPAMMDERLSNIPGKKKLKTDRVVRREICRIITPGTKTYSYIDGDDCHSGSRVLLALCEDWDTKARRYGVCFVDCAVGKVWMSEFDDDYQCSRLRTLLAQYPPAEVLFPKRRLSPETDLVLNGLTVCKLEPLAPKSQFLTAGDALKKVSTNGYFASNDKNGKSSDFNEWPEALQCAVDDGDILNSKCKKSYELGVSSFGAIIWYLEKCLIDYDILTLKLFEKYEPPEINEETTSIKKEQNLAPPITTKTMVLDSATLRNLDVLNGGSKSNNIDGTLLELLDSCSTPFGRRLLRHWLCNPLCNVEAIVDRQEAVAALLERNDFMEKATSLLKQMPDLERLLQKIHTMGTSKRLDHPDSRAVFFELDKYNKRKVEEFQTTLEGLHKILDLVDEFKNISDDVKARLLRRCLLTDPGEGGRLPNLHALLKGIESKFDGERAKKEGIIVMTADIAEINQKITNIESEFAAYLREQRKKFSSSAVRYATGKNRYMLEIPDSISNKLISEDVYKYSGQIKGFRRFMTDETTELLEELQKAEEERDAASRDSMRRVFELFSDSGEKWRFAVDCMAVVDVLISLARYAQNCEHSMCIPKIVSVSGNQKPFIEIVNGYHPCSAKIYTTLGQFVPNDTVLGKDDTASIMLLTGPNMGGKSTLMRQVASLVILAQIGSYVPAESFSLSVVDRIFTRLGACDRLSAGQSTFAVELTETNMILRHATAHSLVIVDELGRGTATHDGAAIAFAVLKHLASSHGGPRTIFSTHYHSLVTRFHKHDNISLGHMACKVENENDDNPTEETITFLYKLAPGACPKSYGFHAAKLAGISDEIVAAAYKKARDVDSMLDKAHRLRNLAIECQSMSDEDLVAAMTSLSTSQ